MKSIFYVFLDIDGVLWDNDFYLKLDKSGRLEPGAPDIFKPESMNALNFLLESLENEFDARLVVSSSRREYMKQVSDSVLKDNGLVYDKELLYTPTLKPEFQRGLEILTFLSDKSYYDYVVIDDEEFDFCKYISPDKIIHTDWRKECLNIKQVEDFLECLEISKSK